MCVGARSFPAKAESDAVCSDEECAAGDYLLQHDSGSCDADDDDCRNQLIDELYEAQDGCLTGMKASLNAKNKKLKSLELHQACGCVGYHPDCNICKQLKRRIQ